ncbi:hypothetical protein CGCF415_v004060 [Colletotrichum fructicola]|uniref:Uncharacterized protein n=1 Tax=Colletotrichum fructicola (strain Nara gc5) TaxID=1213859 RepID=A0A7J6JIB4_COLFN|nr:uncharacterized protein CGMCC3_g4864 [Colletotrichum fructicola]KAF4489423.1 hypothetical protein CGGC5_v003014 [Colletotrichum fructicola Nara gc5]KAE9579293.1 hypothetical protein CGMCC3_g4864 [Colletotrichum fructicola]KAF4432349.1 hypothetical protein CFRS1_v013087 [Colletotrichum fructicola]KAF4892490.1 hypothetical protein CGCFRS4_v007606 [Colletotrichum fructicola]KAF4912072.1 hypothetical protein CGCF415_v004060 [Colletotrichum fructicola]
MTILFLRGLRKRTRSFRSVPSPPPSKRQSIEIGNIDPVKLEERLTELYGAGCFQINLIHDTYNIEGIDTPLSEADIEACAF